MRGAVYKLWITPGQPVDAANQSWLPADFTRIVWITPFRLRLARRRRRFQPQSATPDDPRATIAGGGSAVDNLWTRWG